MYMLGEVLLTCGQYLPVRITSLGGEAYLNILL